MGNQQNEANKPLAYKNIARSAINAAFTVAFAYGIDYVSRKSTGVKWDVPQGYMKLARLYASVLATDVLGETFIGFSGYTVDLPNIEVPIVKDLVSYVSKSFAKTALSVGGYMALKAGKAVPRDLLVSAPLILGGYATHVSMPAKMFLG